MSHGDNAHVFHGERLQKLHRLLEQLCIKSATETSVRRSHNEQRHWFCASGFAAACLNKAGEKRVKARINVRADIVDEPIHSARIRAARDRALHRLSHFGRSNKLHRFGDFARVGNGFDPSLNESGRNGHGDYERAKVLFQVSIAFFIFLSDASSNALASSSVFNSSCSSASKKSWNPASQSLIFSIGTSSISPLVTA